MRRLVVTACVLGSLGVVAPSATAVIYPAAFGPPLAKFTQDMSRPTQTSVGDRLSGLAGNDILIGLAGADCLAGGNGNDRLSGGGGNDTLKGGRGRDRLTGGRGNDALVGGPGKNRYSAGSGRDRVNARNRVAETVRCGAGRDRARVDAADRTIGCERVRRAKA